MSAYGNVRLLAIGDVHLGTRPGSLPEDLASIGLEVGEITPAAALAIAIDKAIALDVHAVLFAGDLVESTNARFEALRPLEAAVAKLRAKNIPAIAVVGNHDVEALPRLVERIPGLELLGADGQWQARAIDVNGKPAVEIVGWSFPERRVSTSPVAELLRNPLDAPELPRIGLIHGDLDASGGVYAPFTSAELKEVGLNAWLLGHIHKPSFGATNPVGVPCGYLGSLLGLNPKESGLRGPWLVEVEPSGAVTCEQFALSPLRWSHVELAVDEQDTVADIEDKISKLTEFEAKALDQAGAAPRLLGLRVQLVGSALHYDSIRKWCDQADWHLSTEWVGETAVFVNKVTQKLELAFDLAGLALGDDPLALLAKKMLVLNEDCEARSRLLIEARQAMQGVAQNSSWSRLEDMRDAEDPLSDKALLQTLVRAGTAALHALVAQRESRGGVIA